MSALSGLPIAYAGDTVCVGTLGAVTIDGSVAVPDGQTCILKDTRVKGNVFVYTGATLSANRVQVDGNIQAEGAGAVYVNPGSVVGGNFGIKTRGAAHRSSSNRRRLARFDENRGALSALGNEVDGNLQAVKKHWGANHLLQCHRRGAPVRGKLKLCRARAMWRATKKISVPDCSSWKRIAQGITSLGVQSHSEASLIGP